MKAILAIDAAWTTRNPSGVALVVQSDGDWWCKALAPSYDSFYKIAEGHPVDWSKKHRGSEPSPSKLLDTSAKILGGQPVDIVTIDMPIATVPFNSRRASDSAVSRAWGSRGCSVHSPTSERPGPLAGLISQEFAQLGYTIATTAMPRETTKLLVEVYPHPAIVKLLDLKYRFEYKTPNARKFWPDATMEERKEKLMFNFEKLLGSLKLEIKGISLTLPHYKSMEYLSRFKTYEDALDALVCAWVGMKYLEGNATPYGDSTATIWIPE